MPIRSASLVTPAVLRSSNIDPAGGGVELLAQLELGVVLHVRHHNHHLEGGDGQWPAAGLVVVLFHGGLRKARDADAMLTIQNAS